MEVLKRSSISRRKLIGQQVSSWIQCLTASSGRGPCGPRRSCWYCHQLRQTATNQEHEQLRI
ncbi:hypothetical protein RchiOBHm_Chr7g0204341 [Rosa chinensis]|uniref:Uncharacterized protein n=1 Tax=Rosa chinensis TaxID=74649 RepID=A0A2P6P8P6_ROSCH|nr:hypothetical protein RchiOBHm_Chr7g0204341 [Rosa chinensis]